jgi:hypothetical protein
MPLEETAANGLRLAARERAVGGAAAQSAVETVPAAPPAALRPDVSDALRFDERAGAIHLTLRGADKAAVLQALAGEAVEKRESGQDARPTAKARAEPADRLRQAEAPAAPSPAEVVQVYRSEEQEHIVARVAKRDLPKVMARLKELGAAAAEVEDQETTRAAPASAEEFVTLDILLVPGKKSTAHER